MSSTFEEPYYGIPNFIIPLSVYANPNLQYSDLFIFFLIEYLDGRDACEASNEKIGGILGIEADEVEASINRLVKQGYLEKPVHKKGRRLLTIDYSFYTRHRDKAEAFYERLDYFLNERNVTHERRAERR